MVNHNRTKSFQIELAVKGEAVAERGQVCSFR